MVIISEDDREKGGLVRVLNISLLHYADGGA